MAPSSTPEAGAEAKTTPLIRLELVQLKFLLKASAEVEPNKDAVLRSIIAIVTENNMAPYYQLLCADVGLTIDQSLLATMQAANAAALTKLEEQLADVTANAGSVEVRDALYAIAAHHARIGDKDKAVAAFQTAYEKSAGVGQRLDVIFDGLRLALLFGDRPLIRSKLNEATKLMQEGGDWDRRNRLKVYEATFLLSTRSFLKASSLYIDTLATFTSTELMSTQAFVRYAILSTIVGQDRVVLKTKIIDSPEVLEVLNELGPMRALITSLYDCRYDDFFRALAETEQIIKKDALLNPHYAFVVRELRIRAYAQMLESYKSVTIDSMASKFGVSRSFLDAELSRYIAAQRLNCVIDAVSGVIVTNRPDRRNAQYQAAIKQGDALLNRVQKLSRVMNL